MSYEQKDMAGSVFRNKRKEKDTHPDYQGSIRIGGVDYWLSGWKKTTKDGEAWISLAFKVKEAKPQPEPPAQEAEHRTPPSRTDPFANMKDDIPF